MTTAAEPSSSAPAAAGWWTRWRQSPLTAVVIPYAACIAAQLPLLALYYAKLWKHRPHYQFFPFAILATAAGIYLRWPRREAQPFRGSRVSDAFFVLGLLLALLGAAFVEAWFAAASVYAFVLSFSARTKDGETGKTMLPVALPLLVSLAWPANLDISLITWLQVFSAQASSHVLDLLGYRHYLDGTVLQFPDQRYGVEQACSGVQSFFTLLFVTTVFVVWTHRPWFRSLLLVVTSLFWAVLMNSLRILVIPIAQINFGLDLSSGTPHAMLGYAVLGLAILLVASTDQFLTFVFGPVDPVTFESSSSWVRRFSQGWNALFAGESEESEGRTPRARRRVRLPSTAALTLMAGGAVLMVGVGIWTADAAWRSLNSGLAVRFFDEYKIVPLDRGDLPTENGKWIAMADESGEGFYTSEERKRGSDLGVRSDRWVYASTTSPYRAVISFDQPFPGWHELTRCYLNSGWKMVADSRIRKGDSAADDEAWPYVQAEFVNPLGERGFLIFGFFDAFGEPFDAPGVWNNFNSLIERVKNRLSNRIRARLFKSESYQVQVFVQRGQPLTEDERREVEEQFLAVRQQVREAFLKRRQASTDPPAVAQLGER